MSHLEHCTILPSSCLILIHAYPPQLIGGCGLALLSLRSRIRSHPQQPHFDGGKMQNILV